MTDTDLPARLEAVLAERFTEPVNPFSEMRVREQGPDGWPASYSVGARRVAEVLRELLAAPAAPVGSAPATTRDALVEIAAQAIRDAACPGNCGKTEEECARDRIQPFVWHHGRLAVVEGTPEMFADAVLAALPTSSDQADEAEAHRLALSTALSLGTSAPWDAIHDRVTELRRIRYENLRRAEEAEAEVEGLRADRAAVLRQEADRIDAMPEAQAAVLRKGVTWTTSELRRVTAETPQSETEASAPTVVCEGFQWIGQSFATCDRCGQPAWEHAGEDVAVEGAGPFDTRRTVRPWKPGEADAIRAKWGTPAAVAQPAKEAEAQQVEPRQACACGQDGCEYCDVNEEA